LAIHINRHLWISVATHHEVRTFVGETSEINVAMLHDVMSQFRRESLNGARLGDIARAAFLRRVLASQEVINEASAIPLTLRDTVRLLGLLVSLLLIAFLFRILDSGWLRRRA
jgi:hypothetical protein